MEWRPAGWSVCLPLLMFPCTIKSRSSLLAPAHQGGPGKRAVVVVYVIRTTQGGLEKANLTNIDSDFCVVGSKMLLLILQCCYQIQFYSECHDLVV